MLPKLAWDRVAKDPGESQNDNNFQSMAFRLAARRGAGFRPFKSLILTHPKWDRPNAFAQFGPQHR
jgi:hypothetical protein